MATKKATSTKTITPKAEKPAAPAPSARVAKPSTTRVKTVKHSKATPIEVPAAPKAVEIPAVLTTVVSAPVEDPHAAISAIAYGYWEARGYQGGDAADDWFRAEAEYRSRA